MYFGNKKEFFVENILQIPVMSIITLRLYLTGAKLAHWENGH